MYREMPKTRNHRRTRKLKNKKFRKTYKKGGRRTLKKRNVRRKSFIQKGGVRRWCFGKAREESECNKRAKKQADAEDALKIQQEREREKRNRQSEESQEDREIEEQERINQAEGEKYMRMQQENAVIIEEEE